MVLKWLKSLKTNIEDQTSNSLVRSENLDIKPSSTQKSYFFNSLFGSVTDITEKVGNTAIQASQAVKKVTVNVTGTVNLKGE